ncbi:MAG: ABC transporter ATP-binding protein [Thermoleophilia bacterium]|nr:ABC transporter ATP-binding protein [Thermoleophilia bacterium]
MSDLAIRTVGLGKKYRRGLHVEPYRTARDAIASLVTTPFGRGPRKQEDPWFWAVRDLTFDVAEGTVLGVIGPNGAGKTTLLKLLSRVTTPTEGYAEFRGRVATLLEVGTGFHLELTGRENIKLNGAILGLGRKQIAERIDRILDFAEVREFADTPVKRYSSGMFMRLAFSVAAHLEPDILIVDEVLAVGDAAFQKKCLGRLGEVGAEGRTVLFVSHNMAAVNQLCDRALVLNKGHIELEGSVRDVTEAYLTSFAGASAEALFEPRSDSPAYISRLVTTSAEGRPQSRFTSDEAVVLEVDFEVVQRLDGARVWAWLYSADGTWLCGATDSEANPSAPATREAGAYRTRFAFPAHVLNEGAYQFRALISTQRGMRNWDYHDDRSSGFFELEDTTDYTSSDLGKRRSLLLVPMAAEEQRIERHAAVVG